LNFSTTMTHAPATTTPGATPSASSPAGKTPPAWRTRAIVVGALIAGLGYAAYWATLTQYQEVTEDAYVDGNLIQITPQMPGTVVAIHADNTGEVHAGDVIVELDSLDARLAVSRAEAQLGKTVRQVRNQLATAAQLQASVEVRRSELARLSADQARRSRLVESGAISQEEAQHATDAVAGAEASLAAARQQAAAQQALVDQTSVESHPEVLASAAQLRDAYVALERMRLPAPVSGVVTKRSVQVGQRVTPGTSLLAIVPLDDLWINANFKESQLRHIRAGQPVKVTAELYGSRVVFDGKVVGFDAGTGSAFSLLPAQNATGNWIKTVQRLPVRIALNPQQVAQHPLRIGLSTKVTVDTHDRHEDSLGQATASTVNYKTDVFAQVLSQAEERIQQVIRANQGTDSAERQYGGRAL
jgi:membrane fusion protein (multidrug efflux system)